MFTDCYFSCKFNFPRLLYLGMLELRWMGMHLWMNLIKRTINIQGKSKIVKIYVSHWRVILLWYLIFWQSSIQRGWQTMYTTLHNNLCSKMDYPNLFKLLLGVWNCFLYSPNPHCCLGKLPLLWHQIVNLGSVVSTSQTLICIYI